MCQLSYTIRHKPTSVCHQDYRVILITMLSCFQATPVPTVQSRVPLRNGAQAVPTSVCLKMLSCFQATRVPTVQSRVPLHDGAPAVPTSVCHQATEWYWLKCCHASRLHRCQLYRVLSPYAMGRRLYQRVSVLKCCHASRLHRCQLYRVLSPYAMGRRLYQRVSVLKCCHASRLHRCQLYRVLSPYTMGCRLCQRVSVWERGPVSQDVRLLLLSSRLAR